jgi:hypothetical protein
LPGIDKEKTPLLLSLMSEEAGEGSGAPHLSREVEEWESQTKGIRELQVPPPDCVCTWSSILQVLKSHGQDYLVGNRLSRADIHLVELVYHVEELDSCIMISFPLLQVIPFPVSERHLHMSHHKSSIGTMRLVVF